MKQYLVTFTTKKGGEEDHVKITMAKNAKEAISIVKEMWYSENTMHATPCNNISDTEELAQEQPENVSEPDTADVVEEKIETTYYSVLAGEKAEISARAYTMEDAYETAKKLVQEHKKDASIFFDTVYKPTLLVSRGYSTGKRSHYIDTVKYDAFESDTVEQPKQTEQPEASEPEQSEDTSESEIEFPEELKDNLMFWFRCSLCRLFSDGVCDAHCCLYLPDVIDYSVFEKFDKCFKSSEPEPLPEPETDYCRDIDYSEIPFDLRIKDLCYKCKHLKTCFKNDRSKVLEDIHFPVRCGYNTFGELGDCGEGCSLCCKRFESAFEREAIAPAVELSDEELEALLDDELPF